MCLSVHIDSVSVFPARTQSAQSNLKCLMAIPPYPFSFGVKNRSFPTTLVACLSGSAILRWSISPRLLLAFCDSKNIPADKCVEPCLQLPVGTIMKSDKANRRTWYEWRSSEGILAYIEAVYDTVPGVLQSVPCVISLDLTELHLTP